MWTYFSGFLSYNENGEIKNYLLDLKNSLVCTKIARAQVRARKLHLPSYVKLHFLLFKDGLESQELVYFFRF